MKRSPMRRSRKPMKRTSFKRSRKPMRRHKEFVPVEIDRHVHLGETCIIKRIFLSEKAAVQSGLPWAWAPRAGAVESIRRQVFDRAAGHCEVPKDRKRCNAAITWESGEMHERQPRGMTGFKRGEISVENSLAACKECHRREHANRRLVWRKDLSAAKPT